MTAFININELKEKVSMSALLSRLGYEPVGPPVKGELLYLSMLRDSDKDPSFRVNDKLGVWYDFGTGKGGNLIDFGVAYWKDLNFNEVLAKIKQVADVDVSALPSLKNPDRISRPRLAIKLPNYKIEEIKPVGSNYAITSYLKHRGVWDVAAGDLKEIYYFVEDEKKRRKQFFAVGWQNEKGGWEVRNKYFKGCLGQKAMTVIPGDPDWLCIYEGYMNYKSWQYENRNRRPTIVVLNSLAFLKELIEKAKEFKKVDSFFDNDTAGRLATVQLIEKIPQTKDNSYLYSDHNDYNDKHRYELERLLKNPDVLEQNLSQRSRPGLSR